MSIAVTSADVTRPRSVASWRHSFTIMLVFLVLALSGALLPPTSADASAAVSAHSHLVRIYLQLLALEWALFLFVWKRGLQRTGRRLSPGMMAHAMTDILTGIFHV